MTRQTIFITGAASGIGKATALQFHRRGWFVGATDIGEAGLAALAEELNGDCFTAHLDVRDKSEFDSVIQQFSAAANHRLDILFNNGGIAVFGFLDEIPFEKVIDTVNVNLMGVLNGMHAALPLLKKTPNSLCFTTSSSAACVWDAYQSDKLHWYVPEELVERDGAKASNPEQLRDELIAVQKK